MTVPMPEWAAPGGPWCLKQWLAFGDIDGWSYCLLEPDHTGDYRLISGRYVNFGIGLFIGQGRMKTEEEVSLKFYEADH